MIFYNGFNLLVDIIVGWSAWFFTYRFYRYDYYKGYDKALSDVREDIKPQQFPEKACRWIAPAALVLSMT